MRPARPAHHLQGSEADGSQGAHHSYWRLLLREGLAGLGALLHRQHTIYKALRLTGAKERIIAIGGFFFVRVWQDSELVSIGELQLLWKDRISEQTLISLRLYFLPENTPDGRNLHGE
ncbi:putative AT-rich interactive domain-containing protein 5B, partial [Operophtera brumata]